MQKYNQLLFVLSSFHGLNNISDQYLHWPAKVSSQSVKAHWLNQLVDFLPSFHGLSNSDQYFYQQVKVNRQSQLLRVHIKHYYHYYSRYCYSCCCYYFNFSAFNSGRFYTMILLSKYFSFSVFHFGIPDPYLSFDSVQVLKAMLLFLLFSLGFNARQLHVIH